MELEKEVYENGAASLAVYINSDSVWLGAGIAGLYMSNEVFADAWPLLRAYAEELELDKEELPEARGTCKCPCHVLEGVNHVAPCC